MGQGEQSSIEEVLLKVLPGQGKHSVSDIGSSPAGHVSGSTHSDEPSLLNFPSVQEVQLLADEMLLKVFSWQGTQALSEIAPTSALAFPAPHARQ